jgi:hypothetical protein
MPSVVLNGHTYQDTDFVDATRPYNYKSVFPFPILTDFLAEVLIQKAGISSVSGVAPGAAGGYLRSDGANWVRVSGVAAADVTAGSFGAGAFTVPGTLAVGANAGTGGTLLTLNGAAGNVRDLAFASGGLSRWLLRASNSAESGSDAGTGFQIVARHDDGTIIDSPIQITRAAGGAIAFTRTLVIGTDPGGTAFLRATDGTTLTGSALPATAILGAVVVVASAVTTGAILGGVVHVKQTAANPTGSAQGFEGYVNSANPTATTSHLMFGLIGNVEHSGAGTLDEARGTTGGVVLSGSGTLTLAKGFDVAGGSKKVGGATGTIGTYVGYHCGDLSTSGAGANFALQFDNCLEADYSTTADDTRLLVWDVTAGAFKRVVRGAADSAGTGFRTLRIPN